MQIQIQKNGKLLATELLALNIKLVDAQSFAEKYADDIFYEKFYDKHDKIIKIICIPKENNLFIVNFVTKPISKWDRVKSWFKTIKLKHTIKKAPKFSEIFKNGDGYKDIEAGTN